MHCMCTHISAFAERLFESNIDVEEKDDLSDDGGRVVDEEVVDVFTVDAFAFDETRTEDGRILIYT